MSEAEESSRKVECKNCGAALPSDWARLENQPCPKCGSNTLHISLQFGDRMVLRDCLEGKVKDLNYKSKRKRASREFKEGFYPQRAKPGKWAYVCQVIDRKNDTYDKRVVDEETGEVLRECHKRLSDHKGHGSAKRGTPEGKGNTC